MPETLQLVSPREARKASDRSLAHLRKEGPERFSTEDQACIRLSGLLLENLPTVADRIAQSQTEQKKTKSAQ